MIFIKLGIAGMNIVDIFQMFLLKIDIYISSTVSNSKRATPNRSNKLLRCSSTFPGNVHVAIYLIASPSVSPLLHILSQIHPHKEQESIVTYRVGLSMGLTSKATIPDITSDPTAA